MKVRSIPRHCHLFGSSLPFSRSLYPVWTPWVCLFWGFDNMPPFSHLRSNYPLNLTLLERQYMCALTRFYIAGLTSPRTIPISLLRHNHPIAISIYPRSCSNACSSACAPLASKSTCRVCRFRLHIDEQLMTPVEPMCKSARQHSTQYLRVAGFVVVPSFTGMCRCWVPFSRAERDGNSELGSVALLSFLSADIGASQVR
jgi:hypothetical protein